MTRKKPAKPDDTLDVRRKLRDMGREPVPEPSDKLRKAWDAPEEDDA